MPVASSNKTYSPESKKMPWIGYHVDDQVCTLGPSHLVAVMRLKGVSHETREQSVLNAEFERQNRCFQALGKQEGHDLMIQTYTLKSRVKLDTHYHFELPILQDFADAYTQPFREGEFRQVDYAMALILKHSDLEDGITRLKDLLQICTVMLGNFGVTVLGMKEKNGQLYSEVGRFYSSVFNGTDQEVLITDSRLGDSMLDSETGFGAYDYVENRSYNGDTRFGITYDLMDLPTQSSPGMWDEVLEEQCDFCLTQTFHFAERNKIKTKINIQKVDLANSEGESKQTKQLEEDVLAITQGSLVLGMYSASLIVYGPTPDKAVLKGARLQSLFTTKDTVFKRSYSSNLNTWYSQWPGYTEVIYRSPRSTENLACGFSLHVTPGGKATGNPIGDGSAIMPMKTANGGLYFRNFHDSPAGKDSTGEMRPGHASWMAMTGAGKTTDEGVSVMFVSRFDTLIFGIDYNRAMENLMRALGATYFTVVPGFDTGIQPFQWPDSVGVRQFLISAVKMMVGEMSSDDEKDVQTGISAVMAHEPVHERSFSLLYQGLPYSGPGCVAARLERWCSFIAGREGPGMYSWVLDSKTNRVNPENYRRVCFDCTKILKKAYAEEHGEVMSVLISTFFYMKDVMKAREPTSPLLFQISEFWACLMHPQTLNAVKEALSAGRTRGEFLFMDTQNPEQVLGTEAGPSVVQQIVTTAWMANKNADRINYEKFGVKGKQFDKVRDLALESRQMMIKQGGEGVMVDTALNGPCSYFIPLFSSSIPNLAVAEEIRKQLNSDDPAIWVRPFLDEMVAVKARQITKSSNPDVWYPVFTDLMNGYKRNIYPLVLQREVAHET